MTYKEHYGTVENKVKEESQRWLEDIEKEGYQWRTYQAVQQVISLQVLSYGLFYHNLNVDRHTEQCFRVPIERLNKTY